MMSRRHTTWIAVFMLLLLAGIGCTPALKTAATNEGPVGRNVATAQAATDPGSTEPASTNSGAELVDDTRPTVTVEIKNFQFAPDVITVAPGTQIVFVNLDETEHNVVHGTASQVSGKDHQPLFSSPDLSYGEQWALVLDEPGVYEFSCTIAGHYLMGMTGTIHVVEGAEVAAAPAGSSTGSSTATVSPATVSPVNVSTMNVQAAGNQSTSSVSTREIGTTVDLNNLPEGMTATPEGLVELQPFKVEGNVKEFAVEIQEVTHELIEGVEVTAWAFNGALPGPTLRVNQGDLVRVHFTNTHHQPHTIHWHGIYAAQEHDGVPHTSRAVMPGETHVYEFVAEHAGTFLYHCHVDSYRHIDMGMYGTIIVEPEEKTWDREYTLVLDDWDSDIEPMAHPYEPDHNYFLVNGKAFPDVATLPLKIGETTRIRLVNVGYNNFAMHMHGPHFTVVATDGHDLPMPYDKDTLDIAPGERYDIEVRPTKVGAYPFHAHNIQYVRNNGLYPGGMHLMIDIVDEDWTEDDYAGGGHSH